MLGGSDGSRHPRPVPNLRGKALSFSLLSMIVAVVLKNVLYETEERPFNPQIAASFYPEWMWSSIKAFSASIEIIVWFFFFSLLIR